VIAQLELRRMNAASGDIITNEGTNDSHANEHSADGVASQKVKVEGRSITVLRSVEQGGAC
jgi:hypothetical protein